MGIIINAKYAIRFGCIIGIEYNANYLSAMGAGSRRFDCIFGIEYNANYASALTVRSRRFECTFGIEYNAKFAFLNPGKPLRFFLIVLSTNQSP